MVTRKPITPFNVIIRTIALSIAVLTGFACERIYEEPTDNVDDAIAFAADIHAPVYLYRDIEHVYLNLINNGFNQENCTKIANELGANITLIDSLMAGEDSVRVSIEFNPSKPRFFDNVKRSGKVYLTIYSDYTEFGSVQKVEMDSTKPYQWTQAEGIGYSCYGKVELQREQDVIGGMKLSDFYITKFDNQNKEQNWLLNADLNFKLLIGTLDGGLKETLFEASGFGTMALLKSTKEYRWNISLPMRFNQEFGCAQYATQGIVLLDHNQIRYSINFDPFDTKACNKIIEVSKGGTVFEARLP